MARAKAINEVRPVLEEIDKGADVIEKGLEAIENGVDSGAEAVEKGVHVAVEEARQAVTWMRNPKIAMGLVMAINVAGAGFVGWKLAKRHFTKKYEAELEREMESARKFYGRLNKVDDNGDELTPEKLAERHRREEKAEQAAEALKEYQAGPMQYDKLSKTEQATVAAAVGAATDTPITSNIFLDGRALNPEEFDLTEEIKNRDPESPYVVSKDEFMENEPDYVQHSIVYYAGDDTLVDERDQPIEEIEATVGTENLSRFGHGSGDKNIVYIRNDRVEADFEVAYSGGNYSEEVLGFIQHSDRPVRKFRRGDDE